MLSTLYKLFDLVVLIHLLIFTFRENSPKKKFNLSKTTTTKYDVHENIVGVFFVVRLSSLFLSQFNLSEVFVCVFAHSLINARRYFFFSLDIQRQFTCKQFQ